MAEIDHSLGQLKHQGVCLFASYGEKFLGDPWFDPVLEALNDRDAVVFVHPALHPSSRTLELPWPGFMMEYVFDTTRAAVNLVFSGAIERFPRIRFVLAHAGGLMPYFAWRLSVSPMIDKRLEQMSPARGLRAAAAVLVRQCAGADRRDLRMPQGRGAGRTRSCSAATGRLPTRAVIAEAVRTYEGVAMPRDAARRHRPEQCLVAFPAVRMTV